MKWLLPAALFTALAVVLLRVQAPADDGSNTWDQAPPDSPDLAPPDHPADAPATSWIDDAMASIRLTAAKVLQAGAGFNVLQLADGTVVRQQGARNWRNNNPGNIEFGAFAVGHGAIGTDGRFAIFPTYEMGRAAKEDLIFNGANYRDLTLTRAIARYAPPTENDTLGYQRTVLGAVGGLDQPMRAYTEPQRQLILDAMERQEGFRVGSTTIVPTEA